MGVSIVSSSPTHSEAISESGRLAQVPDMSICWPWKVMASWPSSQPQTSRAMALNRPSERRFMPSRSE